MKKLNNKGFAISTLIYGILILFILITSVLIGNLIFRYNLFLDLSSNAYYYDYKDIDIHLYNDDKYESKYLVPYDGTYYFYEVADSVDKVDDETVVESVKIYLEKNQEIELRGKKLKTKDKEIYEIDDGNKIIINKISSSNVLNIPNKPDLTTGLVPIKYDEDLEKWVVVRETSQWYNYENQMWANAVSLKDQTLNEPGEVLNVPNGQEITEEKSDVYAMFVWIPRYSYTIGCADIDGKDGINKNVSISGTPTECLGYKIEGASNLSLSTPGAIDIKFVNTNTRETYTGDPPIYTYTIDNDRNPTNWYTHPAFWWDNNNDDERKEGDEEELTGIWVGKFETTGTKSTPTILPNQNSFIAYQNESPVTNKTVSYLFEGVLNFTKENNNYGLVGYSHMSKNSEWGAIAYLSQSKYGKYGNSSYSGVNKEIYNNNYFTEIDVITNVQYNYYLTGVSSGTPSEYASDSIKCRYDDIDKLCGVGASTTGNIYGIYDMNGGTREYVMSYYKVNDNPWGARKDGTNYANFPAKPQLKYFNEYVDGIIFEQLSEENIGHATAETRWWYDDNAGQPTDMSPWLGRGGRADTGNGINTGIFFSGNSGGRAGNLSYGVRTILVNK